MKERSFLRLFLVVPTLIVLYFNFQIFRPFLLPISLAAVLATLCYPVYKWIRVRLKGRRGLAAFLTCLLITVVIILPFVYLLTSLTREVAQVYQWFQEQMRNGVYREFVTPENNPYLVSVITLMSPYVDFGSVDLASHFSNLLQQLSGFLVRHTTGIVTGLLTIVSNFFIMLITMFFLFRDGSGLMNRIRSWTPLSVDYEDIIAEKFRAVARATVVGSLLTAVAQGLAAGIVYWSLGMPNSLFWGSLSALLSLVPVVGTALVWVPWAIYFLLSGSWVKALLMALLMTLVVGSIDNLIRPLLIEGGAKLNTLLVFFSIMGGISYFGIVGLIFGPIVVALGLTFIELYKTEFQSELSKNIG